MTETLLAGPILRRTTRNRVCVWLATTEALNLQLTVIDSNGHAPLGQSNTDDLAEQRQQLGKNLYVYLLQARRDNDDEYPTDQLLCYRLDQVSEGGAPKSLLNHAELAYGGLQYPSFFIPSKLNNLLHGSCRKPHGGFAGVQKPMPDALSHGHWLLETSSKDIEQRPPVLLLTGDQIYADDVAISLLAMLREQSSAITGKQEILPLVESSSRTDPSLTPDLNPQTILLHGRKQALKQKYKSSGVDAAGKSSGFSSGRSENHLLTFGEYASMYIYVFGNRPGWDPVWDWQDLNTHGVLNLSDAELVEELEENKSAIKTRAEQEIPLRTFHETLPEIRKLLANISTYMIFDDHDITDDWNITGNWYEEVRDSPLGRRIVANGLAAYWAFQAWGNDPDNFDKDLIFSITQQLNDNSNDGDIGDRYDLHTWKSRGWGFSIPTEPPIIAIDSRTQRQFDNKYYPAQLLDRYALDWLRVEWAKLKTDPNIDDQTCPLLIATTPVMGFSKIEFIQHLGLWLTGLVESWRPIRFLEKLIDKEGFLTGWMVNKLDAESWSSNKEGFVAFMDTLALRMGIERCAFLSGDVHYAFTADAQFKHRSRLLQCYQMTSTSLNNQPNDKQANLLKEAGEHGTGRKTHRNWALFADQRWTADVQLLSVENKTLRVTADCNLGLVNFAGGLPTTHTLLTGNGKLVYRLR